MVTEQTERIISPLLPGDLVLGTIDNATFVFFVVSLDIPNSKIQISTRNNGFWMRPILLDTKNFYSLENFVKEMSRTGVQINVVVSANGKVYNFI